ncbi:hypothetical protein evm_014965 [Chilo suppressalis]|nr:hypothetical protein evm_014965 [Chilo suppressalis]
MHDGDRTVRKSEIANQYRRCTTRDRDSAIRKIYQSDNMVRPKNERIWKHFRETENKSATCRYCEQKYKVATLQKMARHLQKCPQCPINYKEELRNSSISNEEVSDQAILQSQNKENRMPESQPSFSSDNSGSSLEYGVNKFLTLIGDNASNMQKAFRLVKDIHPHVTYLNCAAHTLHLLCKSITKIEVINACKNMTVNMIKTIKRSQVLTSLLAQIVKEKKYGESLKFPCDTRWGSYHACFKSVENTKVALQTLAVHERAILLPSEEKSSLLDENFWKIVQQCKLILEPMSDAIFQLEGNENNIHSVFEIERHEVKVTLQFTRHNNNRK